MNRTELLVWVWFKIQEKSDRFNELNKKTGMETE